MKCPIDQETLVISERNGVEIDYCPKCRGVWLDRGELDKILDRANAETSSTVSQRWEARKDYGERGEYGEGGEYGERGDYGQRRPYGKNVKAFCQTSLISDLDEK
jgi:Uncharacterized protein conserved in bacteria